MAIPPVLTTYAYADDLNQPDQPDAQQTPDPEAAELPPEAADLPPEAAELPPDGRAQEQDGGQRQFGLPGSDFRGTENQLPRALEPEMSPFYGNRSQPGPSNVARPGQGVKPPPLQQMRISRNAEPILSPAVVPSFPRNDTPDAAGERIITAMQNRGYTNLPMPFEVLDRDASTGDVYAARLGPLQIGTGRQWLNVDGTPSNNNQPGDWVLNRLHELEWIANSNGGAYDLYELFNNLNRDGKHPQRRVVVEYGVGDNIAHASSSAGDIYPKYGRFYRGLRDLGIRVFRRTTSSKIAYFQVQRQDRLLISPVGQ